MYEEKLKRLGMQAFKNYKHLIELKRTYQQKAESHFSNLLASLSFRKWKEKLHKSAILKTNEKKGYIYHKYITLKHHWKLWHNVSLYLHRKSIIEKISG